MKKLLAFLSITLLFTSCRGVWTVGDKAAFFEACMDDTKTWVNDPQMAKTYCDCVINKVMKKYPNVNDALDNIETISRDTTIQNCRNSILK